MEGLRRASPGRLRARNGGQRSPTFCAPWRGGTSPLGARAADKYVKADASSWAGEAPSGTTKPPPSDAVAAPPVGIDPKLEVEERKALRWVLELERCEAGRRRHTFGWSGETYGMESGPESPGVLSDGRTSASARTTTGRGRAECGAVGALMVPGARRKDGDGFAVTVDVSVEEAVREIEV